MAELELWITTGSQSLFMSIPSCHEKFLISGPPQGGLFLTVKNGPLHGYEGSHSLDYPSETRQIWKDDQGRFIFVVPEISPPKRHMVVNSDFTEGFVIGDFQSEKGVITYPTDNIEIILFINWLAGMGDLLLHAVGIEINGHGYAFAGVSHAGKSTLASYLQKVPGVKILGDDNLALRYLNGQFWIYGTPWHQNPNVCAPGGVPLEKLFFLDRSVEPGLYSLTPNEGISRILQTAFIPYYRQESLPGILQRLHQLTNQVTFFKLSYQLGTDVWELIYRS